MWTGISVATVIVLAAGAGAYYVRHHIPAEIIPDIRAGIAARNVTNPDARIHKFLEERYGSLKNPANRERVFKSFFNVNHIRAMQILVRHSPPDQRQANIQAMAHWVSHYRQTMSPKEKTKLGDYFQSALGKNALKRATAQYMKQDAAYRCANVPVITELMKTLSAIKQ